MTWSPTPPRLLSGLRFDCVAATFWTLAPLLASLLCGFRPLEKLADRLRLAMAGEFLAGGGILLEIATVEFFRRFHDVLNPLIFHAYSDGGGAPCWQPCIRSTTWSDTCWRRSSSGPPACGASAATGAASSSPKRPSAGTRLPAARRTAINLAILLLVVVGLRGSLGSSPVKMKHSAVGSDAFLNRTVLNPYWALASAACDPLQDVRQEGHRGLPAGRQRGRRAAGELSGPSAVGRSRRLPGADGFRAADHAAAPTSFSWTWRATTPGRCWTSIAG